MNLKLAIKAKKVAATVGGRKFTYVTYKLTGKDCRGVRVRFQNQDRAVVAAEKQRLEIEAANFDGEGPKNTHLTAEQVREAEEAFQRISRHPKLIVGTAHPLALAVEHFIRTFHPPRTDKSIRQLVSEFLKEKELGSATTKKASRAYYRTLKADLDEFSEINGDTPPHEFLGDHAFEYMLNRRAVRRGAPKGAEAEPLSPKRWNNLRGVLHAFFAWCQMPPRRFIDNNPFSEVNTQEWEIGDPITLTPLRALELMREVVKPENAELVPYFVLTLFAGIRPSLQDGEIADFAKHPKLFENVNLSLGKIIVPAEVSKVKRRREVTIYPSLRAWLEAYPIEKYPILPTNADKRIKKIRDAHKLEHDVLRHTFISHHIGKFHSVGLAALEAGTSEGVIAKHYHSPATEEEARQFFSIAPTIVCDEAEYQVQALEMSWELSKRSPRPKPAVSADGEPVF